MRVGISILCSVLFCFPVIALAEVSPVDRNEIQQQQNLLLQQSDQQRDALRRLTPDTKASASKPSDTSGPCFTIRTITLRGTTVLSRSVQQSLTEPWSGRCMTLADINQLIHAVSNEYISRGFITSRAFIQPQDLSKGVLVLDILEGKLEKIELDHQQPLMLKTVFPHLQGEILNLRDIEQGMEQINRLSAYQVQIDIQPGSQIGYSIVQLTRQKRFPLLASVGIDNSGQKSTGENQLFANLTADNLLRIADQWYIGGTNSLNYGTSHDANSFMAGVSVPYGYWTINYDYSYNDYRNYFWNRSYQWRSTGSTVTQRFGVQRVLFRNGQMKTALLMGVTHREGENQLNETRLDASSRQVSSFMLGINQSQKLLGGLATFNPAWTRGTTWFGAESDRGKSDDAPRAEFVKWSLASSYYHPITSSVSYLTSLYGQYSEDVLYGSEQMTLGGESSVRGFKEQYLSGNRGGYWRNEVSWQAFSASVPGNVSFTLALDGGWLPHDKRQPYSNGTLWGTSVGVASANRWLSNQFTIGLPLAYPDSLAPDHLVFYYRVGLNF